MDLISLDNSLSSNPLKYKDLRKLMVVERKTNKKNKKIIFIGKYNLVVKIFDLKR